MCQTVSFLLLSRCKEEQNMSHFQGDIGTVPNVCPQLLLQFRWLHLSSLIRNCFWSDMYLPTFWRHLTDIWQSIVTVQKSSGLKSDRKGHLQVGNSPNTNLFSSSFFCFIFLFETTYLICICHIVSYLFSTITRLMGFIIKEDLWITRLGRCRDKFKILFKFKWCSINYMCRISCGWIFTNILVKDLWEWNSAKALNFLYVFVGSFLSGVPLFCLSIQCLCYRVNLLYWRSLSKFFGNY